MTASQEGGRPRRPPDTTQQGGAHPMPVPSRIQNCGPNKSIFLKNDSVSGILLEQLKMDSDTSCTAFWEGRSYGDSTAGDEGAAYPGFSGQRSSPVWKQRCTCLSKPVQWRRYRDLWTLGDRTSQRRCTTATKTPLWCGMLMAGRASVWRGGQFCCELTSTCKTHFKNTNKRARVSFWHHWLFAAGDVPHGSRTSAALGLPPGPASGEEFGQSERDAS